jgi:hypothetical protein
LKFGLSDNLIFPTLKKAGKSCKGVEHHCKNKSLWAVNIPKALYPVTFGSPAVMAFQL